MGRSRKKKRRQLMMLIAVVVFVLVVIIAVTVMLLNSVKKLKAITITPSFADTELDVNQDYVFSIKANPSKAKLKSLEYVVDDATATFEKGTEADTAVLHTGAEGVVTLYVKKDKIESNKITLQVVDQVRKAEEEAAAAEKAAEEARLAAEAAAQEEVETEAATLVMVTGDSVRMRSDSNTDSEIVRTCKKGETYEKVEAVDDWTKVLYDGRECYIKSEFLREVTKEEAESAKAEIASEDEKKKEEEKKDEKKEEKKTEEKKPEDTAAQDAAQAQADAEKAAQDAAAAEEAAKAAEAAAAQAAAAAKPYTLCGVQVTADQYKKLLDMWRYATPNGTDEEVKAFHESHHTAGDIQSIISGYGL